MKLNFDISKDEFNIVNAILVEHLLPNCKAYVFGSRVKNKTKHYSDLDLAIEGAGKIDHKVILNLKEAFNESRLPYKVDILDINDIDENFKKIIDAQKIAFPFSNCKTPQLRFPEFSGEWEEKRLGDLGEFRGGGTPDTAKNHYWTGDIPWVSSSDLHDDTIHKISISRFISSDAIKESATKIIPKNSILLVSRVGVGKFAVTLQELCTSQDFSNFTPNNDNVFFLAYCLYSNKSKLLSLCQGTSIKGFTNNDLRLLQIDIPEKAEQQKIANFLTAIDKRIEYLSKKLELLQEYKKGVMQRIFSQKIRFKDDNGNNFPDWEEKKVSDVFRVTRGNVLAVSKMTPYPLDDSIYPVYSSQTKSNGLTGYFSEYLYQNAITWTTDGANAGEVKYRTGKFYCTNVCGVLLSEAGFANNCIAEMLNKVTEKYVSYVGNPKLMNNIMGQIKINFPHPDEQTKIANFLNQIDNKIAKLQSEIESNKEYKKGLLQQMFV